MILVKCKFSSVKLVNTLSKEDNAISCKYLEQNGGGVTIFTTQCSALSII